MSGEDRDFLFSSLEDLEREYAAGDLDDADYEALKSSYVKRLADVLRGTEIIEDIAENTNIVPTRNRKKIVLSIAPKFNCISSIEIQLVGLNCFTHVSISHALSHSNDELIFLRGLKCVVVSNKFHLPIP